MKGYCLVAKKNGEIFTVSLIEAVANVHPVESIKTYCRRYGVLGFPVDHWDEHEDDIEWFVVRCVEKLDEIKWPDARNGKEEQIFDAVAIQVYRAFEIPQINFKRALKALDNPVVTRALGLGWSPRGVKEALHDLAWAIEVKDQAEAYREGIMDMVEDITSAIEATEELYEQDAEQFLEEEGGFSPPEPKEPENMTDEELIDEATQLHSHISHPIASGVGDEKDILRYHELEEALVFRNYEICIGAKYSAQKREEE